jgi:hypothetical protein
MIKIEITPGRFIAEAQPTWGNPVYDAARPRLGDNYPVIRQARLVYEAACRPHRLACETAMSSALAAADIAKKEESISMFEAFRNGAKSYRTKEFQRSEEVIARNAALRAAYEEATTAYRLCYEEAVKSFCRDTNHAITSKP